MVETKQKVKKKRTPDRRDKLNYSNVLSPFGFVLKSIREEHGDKRKDLAKKLGVTSPFIYNIEVGKRKVPRGWVEKISNVYDLDDSWKRYLETNAEIGDEEVIIEIPKLEFDDKIVSLAYDGKICSLTNAEINKIRKMLEK